MSETAKPPGYMAQLLEELGWNQGTRIPLADPQNQNLETLLINRQNEIQHLKESLILQNQKRDDLNKYKDHVHSEYQENTRLLFAHKQQMEQEVKLKQLSCNEADRLERDVIDSNKESKDISTRTDKLQLSIGRLLKKADSLKSEVCGERGALQEWRAALERSAGDISAIEQFTKQDLSKAKALETKRQKLKVEHDRMQERLNQLVSNLSAEERACERISVQVMEGMDQRKQMMTMWTSAVENLRQRDNDIRHIREDYAVLESESNNLADQCREQQAFCDQQRGNNADAIRHNMSLATQLSQTRLAFQNLAEQNLTLDSEAQSLQRELSNMRVALERLHIENRQIMEDQHKKDSALQVITSKLKELKEKLTDSLDKSKSSEKRAKELEDILNEEERYATNLTVNQQRAMHCSFVEQQKLLNLKNEEKLFHMQLKASRAIMSKLDNKQRGIQRNLQSQKESLYSICYQVETIGAQVSHMEGAQAERECSAELVERENRLKEVCGRHAARLALLERHSARLHDDMRRLARELETLIAQHNKLQSRLKSSVLNVEGGDKDLKASRDIWRKARVEEALMRLRVAHAARALAGLDDTAFTLNKQQLQLDAAMNERLVEITARRDMFSIQKRALFEDCGKLRSEIKEREQRIEQLKKRYEIFIGSLGKDDSGQQLSVTFFKIKFAAERAELRSKGAALDADIGRREKDVSALEATIRVVQAAHSHFMHHISPLDDDTEDGLVERADRHHPPLDVTVSCDRAKVDRTMQAANIAPSTDWNFGKADFTLLFYVFTDISWNDVLDQTDVNEAVDSLYNVIYDSFDKCIPKKVRRPTSIRRYPTWYTKDILSDLKLKSSLHKIWKASRDRTIYSFFRALRSYVKVKVSTAYDNHIKQIEEELVENPKAFWNHISSLKTKGGFEPSVKYNNSSYSGPHAAKAYADYFSSVFLPNTPVLNPNEVVNTLTNNLINIISISSIEIEHHINKLKSKSSIGPDNVPSYIIKAFKSELSVPLTHIFNLSLNTGTYPARWKISRVTPIPKSSDKTHVEGYRPIAILSSFAKLFESLLHSILYKHITPYLSNSQHAFRKGKSVNTNLLTLVNFISKSLDNNTQVDVVYLDFRKAFDRVDNDVLLRKLNAYGLAPKLLRFFASYLSDRKQYVRLGCYSSTPYHTRSGVSQGSSLGPLLFTIMIDDLTKYINSDHCLIYADDVKIFRQIRTVQDSVALQSDIDAIQAWSDKNLLQFNTSKCQVMSLTHSSQTIGAKYSLNRELITRCHSVKDLGVLFDPDLNFHNHIHLLTVTCFKKLGFVSRNCRDFSSILAVKMLYTSLVRSKLESSACVWNPYQITYSQMLEKVQKRFLRYLYKKIYGYYPFLYPTKFLQGALGFNSLETRRVNSQILFLCRLLRGQVDCATLLDEASRLCVPEQRNRFRSGLVRLFEPVRVRTLYCEQSPISRAQRKLNELMVVHPQLDVFADGWKEIERLCLLFSETCK